MKLLLLQTGFLGDVILSTPCISFLEKEYPGAEISFVTTPLAASLLERDPALSTVYRFDKRAEHAGLAGLRRLAAELSSFDRVYSLHRSARSSLLLRFAGIPERIGFRSSKLSRLYTDLVDESSAPHAVDRNLSIFRSEEQSLSAPMRLFGADLGELGARLKEFVSAGSHIVLCPGSVWKTKRWAPHRYRALLQLLEAQGERVILLGAPNEREVSDYVAEGSSALNLTGETSLPELVTAVKMAKAVVCNDSAILHVASASKTPVVAIFCATDPSFGFGPYQNRSIVLQAKGLYCQPCRRHGSKSCPNGTELCMRLVSEYEALAALNELLLDDGGTVARASFESAAL